MQYNEQLAQYGILAKNTKAYEMRQDKIILSNIEIEEIDLKTLEEQKINSLLSKIVKSIIYYSHK